MKLLSLLYFDLLRMMRNRGLAMALVIVPAAAGGAHFAMARAGSRVSPSWSFVSVFAAFGVVSAAWLHVRDALSGLAEAISCTPVQRPTYIWSRVLTAIVVFLAQLCEYGIVLGMGGSL